MGIKILMYIFSVYGCLCCTCKKCYNKDKSIDLDKDNINEDKDKKNKNNNKKEKKIIDKKLLEDYKICNEMVFYQWHDNNCTVKSILIGLIIIFNKEKIIEDWLKSGNNFLKTLAEIFVRYNNKDTSQDDVSIFFHALLKYLVDYYNNNIEIQKKKTKMDSDFIYIIQIFRDMFPYYKVEKIRKKFKDIEDINELFKNVNKLEFKNYSDFDSNLHITDIIFNIIAKIYNISFEKHYGQEFFQIENDIYIYDAQTEDFDKVPFFILRLQYNNTNILHNCIIYKKEDKYYLENCNTVIEINKELVKICYENDDFQPIIDIYIKNGGLEYKYIHIEEDYYSEYKNVEKKDELIYNLCKRNILIEYNEYPKDEFEYDIEKNSISYNISQDEIKKIFKELNIVKH